MGETSAPQGFVVHVGNSDPTPLAALTTLPSQNGGWTLHGGRVGFVLSPFNITRVNITRAQCLLCTRCEFAHYAHSTKRRINIGETASRRARATMKRDWFSKRAMMNATAEYEIATSPVLEAHSYSEIEDLVSRSQSGDDNATEDLMTRFEPLMRSRAHRLWPTLQSRMSAVEWDDVLSQVRLSFLTRLRDFSPERGVYFSLYITRMIDFDCRAWLRVQSRVETPWSQIASHQGDAQGGEDDIEYSMLANSSAEHTLFANGDEIDPTSRLEQAVSLRAALETLTPSQREAIWRCCVLGKTEHEAAGELHISRSAVRNRLEGALSRMRNFFFDADALGDADENLRNLAARTGRAAPREIELQREFWIGRLTMAKDEKRPDLVGVGVGRPVLLQGVYAFETTGLTKPELLSKKLSYEVPPHCVVGIRYIRVGNKSDGMICVSTVVNGDQHRLIPVAANATIHVPLAIVEPIISGSQIEIHIASEKSGVAIIDCGCLQMPA